MPLMYHLSTPMALGGLSVFIARATTARANYALLPRTPAIGAGELPCFVAHGAVPIWGALCAGDHF